MKLVIAEKPMLARDIARAVCGVQVSEKSQLPISGNGYTVIACSGHLLELVEPDAVNPAWADRYDLDLLPISIPDWPKEPAVVRNRETGEVIDSKEPLIDKIAALLPQADLVIHAGDPDDEGQLIVDEVLDYLGYIGEVLRVYVNDNITKNIVRAFDHLVPNEGCRAAGAAANARSIADKCFGVNESRLASTRLHGGFYVGRVQTPTLGLVVARDEAIENHVTRKFYEPPAVARMRTRGPHSSSSRGRTCSLARSTSSMPPRWKPSRRRWTGPMRPSPRSSRKRLRTHLYPIT